MYHCFSQVVKIKKNQFQVDYSRSKIWYNYSEDCVTGGAVRGGVDCRKSCELNQHDKIAKFIDRIVSIREFWTVTSWMKSNIAYKALTVKQGRIHGIRSTTTSMGLLPKNGQQ